MKKIGITSSPQQELPHGSVLQGKVYTMRIIISFNSSLNLILHRCVLFSYTCMLYL